MFPVDFLDFFRFQSGCKLTLSKTTNFRSFQTERVCRRQFYQMDKNTPWEKEKLFVRSNFSFSHVVSKRLLLQTRKNQGLFGKGIRSFIGAVVSTNS